MENKPQNTPLTENKMGVMPVGKLLVGMSVPMMISMMVQALYNIVDSIFVAQISENALSAVSLAFPLQTLMIAVAGGTGVGVNALVSRALGAKDQQTADRTANIGILLALCSYAVFAILGALLVGPFFRFQTDVAEIVTYGIDYGHICVCASLGIFVQITMERLLQSTGRAKLSMVTQLSGAIINLILDPILIFGLFGLPALGVAGAALATVIGQWIAAAIGLMLNLKKNPEIHLGLSRMKFHGPTVKEFADCLGISQPNATYKINHLIQKGYVEKTPSLEDRREIHLHVTEKYMRYWNESSSTMHRALKILEARFSKEEMTVFARMLETLAEALPKDPSCDL